MITLKDVDYIAALARIRIDEKKKTTFVEQFNTILNYIEKLNEVDTSKVVPMTDTDISVPILKKDTVCDGLSHQDLQNLTEHFNDAGFFEVPKII